MRTEIANWTVCRYYKALDMLLMYLIVASFVQAEHAVSASSLVDSGFCDRDCLIESGIWPAFQHLPHTCTWCMLLLTLLLCIALVR